MLGLDDVSPAGQDPLPGEEYAEYPESNAVEFAEGEYEKKFLRNPPLALELPAPSSPPGPVCSPNGPRFLLEAKETILSARSQTVDLLLRRFDVPGGTIMAAPDRRVLIIDPSPLLISQVRFSDYSADLAAGITNGIAIFSTRRDAVWEITAGARSFPVLVRLALLDMIYNLGLHGMTKYIHFRESLLHRQWKQAAGQCHRQGPSEDRNLFTKELSDAAEVLDPSPSSPLP